MLYRLTSNRVWRPSQSRVEAGIKSNNQLQANLRVRECVPVAKLKHLLGLAILIGGLVDEHLLDAARRAVLIGQLDLDYASALNLLSMSHVFILE